MGEIKDRFFKDKTTGIITVISLGLMLLFVIFIGPEITGSTVFIHPEELKLTSGGCDYAFHKQICLTKIFNPSFQDDKNFLSAYLTVDKQGGQTTSAAEGKLVGKIQYGKSEVINGLVIKVIEVNEIENFVLLNIAPYNIPNVQKTGLEDLWYPFIRNQKLNAIIISDNEDAIKQLREILKPELSDYEIINSFKVGEVPKEYIATNQILIGIISEDSLIKEQLVSQNYDPNTFLEFDQGYLGFITDPTKKYNLQGKNVGPQAVLIITGESDKGLQKSINALRNKEVLVGPSIKV